MIEKELDLGKKRKMYWSKNKSKNVCLKNERDREQYKLLVPHISEKLIELMNDIMLYIQEKAKSPLNEHIHIALTDHISFAIKRLKQGLTIDNPF